MNFIILYLLLLHFRKIWVGSDVILSDNINLNLNFIITLIYNCHVLYYSSVKVAFLL